VQLWNGVRLAGSKKKTDQRIAKYAGTYLKREAAAYHATTSDLIDRSANALFEGKGFYE
jgi:hypothetical protein